LQRLWYQKYLKDHRLVLPLQNSIQDLKLLDKFEIEKETLEPKDNPDLIESYRNWKKLINKHFLSNKAKN